MGKLLEANGRMDNFRRLIGKSDANQRGPVYSDSDMYKWTEAVVLRCNPAIVRNCALCRTRLSTKWSRCRNPADI